MDNGNRHPRAASSRQRTIQGEKHPGYQQKTFGKTQGMLLKPQVMLLKPQGVYVKPQEI